MGDTCIYYIENLIWNKSAFDGESSMSQKAPKQPNDPQLKELIVEQLRKSAPSSSFLVDREKCFAEAADRVLETLGEELFSPQNDSGIDPTVPTAVEKTYQDFVKIRDNLVEQIRVGYLAGNLQMMKALGSAVAIRDTGSGEHNHRVTLYAVRLAESLGLSDKEIQTLIKGSFLHDIGKISISDSILLKPERLSDDEIKTMKSHPSIGAEILCEVKWLEDTFKVVVSHHEKWDGTGYPDKLKGEQIPLSARIFAIVDVFDAMISERPYKPAYAYDEVIAYMKEHSGTHFDPAALKVFFENSKTMHDEIATRPMEELEQMVADIIDRHFQIDLNADRFRSKHSGM